MTLRDEAEGIRRLVGWCTHPDSHLGRTLAALDRLLDDALAERVARDDQARRDVIDEYRRAVIGDSTTQPAPAGGKDPS